MNLERDLRKTKMTRFLCMELMYEYVSGTLDPRRERDIEEYLPRDREAQRELEKVKRALLYTQKASQARVTKTLHEALLSFEPAWQKSLREWTRWGSQRGWRLLPYIFVAATVVLGVVATKPWQRKETKDITLVEQKKNPSDMPMPAPNIATPSAPTPVVSVTVETAEPARSKDAPVAQGEVLRAEIDVPDFSHSWPAIKDKILALGGKKTGSSALGWLRRPNQSYFHFSLPESNFNELELFLRTFGPVRFEREKVPRVMPEGQIRIILTVKDAVTNEGTSEAP